MLVLIFFLLLLTGFLLAAGALWIAVIWLMHEQRADAETLPAFSLTELIARELEARALWRSMSAWMAKKPLRLQDHSDGPRG
jgi:hypothetical protein